MVKKHTSEVFLDKHIWDKITSSSVCRDNLVCPQRGECRRVSLLRAVGLDTGSAAAQCFCLGRQGVRGEVFSFCVAF